MNSASCQEDTKLIRSNLHLCPSCWKSNYSLFLGFPIPRLCSPALGHMDTSLPSVCESGTWPHNTIFLSSSKKSQRLQIDSFSGRWQRNINVVKINGGTLGYIIISFSVSLISESVLDEKCAMHPDVLTILGLARSTYQEYSVMCTHRYFRSKSDAKFYFPNLLCVCN